MALTKAGLVRVSLLINAVASGETASKSKPLLRFLGEFSSSSPDILRLPGTDGHNPGEDFVAIRSATDAIDTRD